MSAIEKKWRTTGLLDVFAADSLDAEILAQNLNDCALLLIGEVPNGTLTFTRNQEFKAATLLPIVVRLFMAGMCVLNMRMLYGNYSQFLVDHPPDLHNPIDEVSYSELYTEYITTDDRINPIIENV